MQDEKLKRLRRFLKGGLPPDEMEIFFDQIHELSEDEWDFVCESLWDEVRNGTIPPEVMTRIIQTVDQKSETDTRPLPKGKPKSNRYIIGWAAAASIAVMVSVGWWLWNTWSNREIEVFTKAGEEIEHILPDQTRILLHENSSLTYQANFLDHPVRMVELLGEAHFDVKKDELNKSQFTVKTSDLSVNVLGTVFNVNTSAVGTKIYLEEGSVALQLHNTVDTSQIFMKPGEVVHFSKEENMVVSHEQVTEESSWRKDILFFNKARVQDVISELEKVYSIELQIQDSAVLQRTVTVGLPNNDLNLAIETIEKILNTKIMEVE